VDSARAGGCHVLIFESLSCRRKKLHGSEHTYRLRVNDYRIIYEIQQHIVTVQIVRIRHRKDVYR